MQVTTERESHQLFNGVGGQGFTTCKQGAAQRGWTVDERAVGQHGARVEWLAILLGAPAAHEVEVLQSQADRVHDLVAGGTDRILAVLLKALAQGVGHKRVDLAFNKNGLDARRW